MPGDIILHVYQKLWLHEVQFLRYGVWQLDEQMGRQTRRQKKTEVGAPAKNWNTVF